MMALSGSHPRYRLTLLAIVLHWIISSNNVLAIYTKDDCSYTFNVWQPDQNVLQQLRDIQMQFANFTNYAELQVSRIQRNVIHEMRQYDNTSRHLEIEMDDMRMTHMQSRLAQSNMLADVNMMRRDLEETSRKVDDLEMEYYSLKTRTREPRNESIRRPHHRSLSKDFVGLMQNSVGDLKAEWLLMKRELDAIRSENVQLRHGQNHLKNDTNNMQNVIRTLSGNIQSVDERDWRGQMNNNIESGMSNLRIELKRMRDTQGDLVDESVEIRNEVATLHTSNIRILKDIHELQLDSTRVREKLESLRREERSGTEREVPRERSEANLPRTDDYLVRDCHELYQAGNRVSGVYNIHPRGAPIMVSVYCEMVNKTGYTVLTRRIDGLLNFNRRWLEYKHGFGNNYGEFYIGNEMLHLLTKQKHYILRVDLWDWEGHKAYAEYDAFTIDDEADNYRLHVGGYKGDAGDSLNYHDNMAFSTEDVDNDLHTRHCAAENKGGWWFNSCYSSHLNGVYHTAWYSQTGSNYADGVVWYTWKESEYYSLKKVEMKLRPKVP